MQKANNGFLNCGFKKTCKNRPLLMGSGGRTASVQTHNKKHSASCQSLTTLLQVTDNSSTSHWQFPHKSMTIPKITDNSPISNHNSPTSMSTDFFFIFMWLKPFLAYEFLSHYLQYFGALLKYNTCHRGRYCAPHNYTIQNNHIFTSQGL